MQKGYLDDDLKFITKWKYGEDEEDTCELYNVHNGGWEWKSWFFLFPLLKWITPASLTRMNTSTECFLNLFSDNSYKVVRPNSQLLKCFYFFQKHVIFTRCFHRHFFCAAILSGKCRADRLSIYFFNWLFHSIPHSQVALSELDQPTTG